MRYLVCTPGAGGGDLASAPLSALLPCVCWMLAAQSPIALKDIGDRFP